MARGNRAPRRRVPTSALDPQMVKAVLDTTVSLADEVMTRLSVSHELGFARQVADRMIFMDAGRIVEMSPPGAFFEKSTARPHPIVREPDPALRRMARMRTGGAPPGPTRRAQGVMPAARDADASGR